MKDLYHVNMYGIHHLLGAIHNDAIKKIIETLVSENKQGNLLATTTVEIALGSEPKIENVHMTIKLPQLSHPNAATTMTYDYIYGNWVLREED